MNSKIVTQEEEGDKSVIQYESCANYDNTCSASIIFEE